MQVFDPATGDWTEMKGLLKHGRAQFSGCMCNGTLFAIGGLNDDGGFNNEPTILDYEVLEMYTVPVLNIAIWLFHMCVCVCVFTNKKQQNM